MKLRLFYLILIASIIPLKAQKPEKLSSNQIYERLQKLSFLGTVLYVAAHPDDENTRLISYFSNKVKARTIYLSLTRGDGGQNLIGSEIRESLGVIITQELLAARRIDGGEQRFSRANDFGYSKHPIETLEVWDKQDVLSDVVWAIRTLKPDVVINRFDHRTPGTTHGHHTASAMLSHEAFDIAGDPTKFVDQLGYVKAWKPNRLFFNTSWWFYGSQEKFKQANKDNFLRFDIGVYYPQKGVSNNEIAALASSQHLCQGFGRLSNRGEQSEYIEFLKGEFPKNKSDLFSGIDTSWNRVKGGKEIGEILSKIIENFNFKNPSVHLPELMQLYSKVTKINNTHWKELKEKELSAIIYACAGLYLEASSSTSSTTPNGVVDIDIEVLNRSSAKISLESLIFQPSGKRDVKKIEMTPNRQHLYQEQIRLEAETITSPYWLKEFGTVGMYTVKNQKLIGLPNTPRNIKVDFELIVEGTPILFSKEVVHRYARRDKGELYQPFDVLPKVTASIENPVIVFPENTSKEIQITLEAGEDKIAGTVELEFSKGWHVQPNFIPFFIESKGASKQFTFTVIPPENQSESDISVIVRADGHIYDKELTKITYDHIPSQNVLKPAISKVVRMDIKKNGTSIGYIDGAGDVVPESLMQIGYEVTRIKSNEIQKIDLHQFDAIVMGVRAYNTVEELKFRQSILLSYVENGGNLIVQYNTTGRSGVDIGAPYVLKISKDRVTDENAKVTFLNKKHALLNTPNKISVKDFEGWVQERGLYFPNTWSKEYTAILGMCDKGENLTKGSLLVAAYGKGNYIYTGLSFFRELPAGVPGAYRLFANLLSYDKQ
jgi:LmbE family N-acetylglucosaminyl deacetylase